MPSYDPVARRLPSPFQSRVVTSLLAWLLSVVCASACDGGEPRAADPKSHILAVESPDLASYQGITQDSM